MKDWKEVTQFAIACLTLVIVVATIASCQINDDNARYGYLKEAAKASHK